jgi:hypothetical protein
MIDKETAKKISEISLVLGKSKKFNIDLEIKIINYLEGVQVNWFGSGHSFMWRSTNWNPNELEHYSGNNECNIYKWKYIM